MRFDDVIFGRRSTRGYRSELVLRRLIEEILPLAMRATPAYNSQPYYFHVNTGEPLEIIKKDNISRILAGKSDAREFRIGAPFVGDHRNRQVPVAKQHFQAMSIVRDDKVKRDNWVLRGFRQIDAPVCIVIGYNRDLTESDDTSFDCGAVATALVNVAWSRGLGTVINSQGIMQSPIVREKAQLPDAQVIMKSIALGWPDESYPANCVVSRQKPREEVATFIGFEG